MQHLESERGASESPDDPISRSISPSELPDVTESMRLLARAQQGEREALEDLLARYQERLRRIVRIQLQGSLLRRHLDSMDLVQDTFRAALPHIGDLEVRGPAGLLNWFSRIALNRIRDSYAAFTTRKRDAAREIDLTESVCHRLAAGEDLPHESAMLAEIRALLDDEVAKLPEDQRRVVLLRDYMGEDWEDIAKEMQRGAGAARQLHQRAWERLRKVLDPKLRGST